MPLNRLLYRPSYDQIFFILFLMILGIFSRLLPHPPNWTAISATGLFGGLYLRSLRSALFIVLGSMWISDWLLGFHTLMWATYSSLFVSLTLGAWIKSHLKTTHLLGGVLCSSLTFFWITNFAVWYEGLLYPQTLSGLYQCYLAALPFLKHQLMGDLFFSSLLFAVGRISLPDPFRGSLKQCLQLR